MHAGCGRSEEIEKQQAKDRYNKLHAEGKTDEARAGAVPCPFFLFFFLLT